MYSMLLNTDKGNFLQGNMRNKSLKIIQSYCLIISSDIKSDPALTESDKPCEEHI